MNAERAIDDCLATQALAEAAELSQQHNETMQELSALRQQMDKIMAHLDRDEADTTEDLHSPKDLCALIQKC